MPLLKEELFYDPTSVTPSRKSFYDYNPIGVGTEINRGGPSIQPAVERFGGVYNNDPANTNLALLNALSTQKYGSKGGIWGRTPHGKSYDSREIDNEFALEAPRTVGPGGQKGVSYGAYQPLRTEPSPGPGGATGPMGPISRGGGGGFATPSITGTNIGTSVAGTLGLTGLGTMAAAAPAAIAALGAGMPMGDVTSAVLGSGVVSALAPVAVGNAVGGGLAANALGSNAASSMSGGLAPTGADVAPGSVADAALAAATDANLGITGLSGIAVDAALAALGFGQSPSQDAEDAYATHVSNIAETAHQFSTPVSAPGGAGGAPSSTGPMGGGFSGIPGPSAAEAASIADAMGIAEANVVSGLFGKGFNESAIAEQGGYVGGNVGAGTAGAEGAAGIAADLGTGFGFGIGEAGASFGGEGAGGGGK